MNGNEQEGGALASFGSAITKLVVGFLVFVWNMIWYAIPLAIALGLTSWLFGWPYSF